MVAIRSQMYNKKVLVSIPAMVKFESLSDFPFPQVTKHSIFPKSVNKNQHLLGTKILIHGESKTLIHLTLQKLEENGDNCWLHGSQLSFFGIWIIRYFKLRPWNFQWQWGNYFYKIIWIVRGFWLVNKCVIVLWSTKMTWAMWFDCLRVVRIYSKRFVYRLSLC